MAERNMYECLPCPKCGSKYRAPFTNPERQDCDECGHTEPWDDHLRASLAVEDPTPSEPVPQEGR